MAGALLDCLSPNATTKCCQVPAQTTFQQLRVTQNRVQFDIYTVSNASHTSQITASEVLRQKEVEGDGGNGHISVLKLGI